MRPALSLCAAFSCLLAGCGYRVAGHTNLVPKNIKTIAVPAFGNATTRYKLADQLHRAVTREFIERTRYKIVADPAKADAVLEASLINFVSYPTVFDQTTGRASGVQANVTLAVTLRDRAAGNAIFQRGYWELKERYEISTDSRSYFDESDTALERLSRDVARGIVSGVLSTF